MIIRRVKLALGLAFMLAGHGVTVSAADSRADSKTGSIIRGSAQISIDAGKIKNTLQSESSSAAAVRIGHIRHSDVNQASIHVKAKNVENSILGGSSHQAIVNMGVVSNSKVDGSVQLRVNANGKVSNTIEGGWKNTSEVSIGAIVSEEEEAGGGQQAQAMPATAGRLSSNPLGKSIPAKKQNPAGSNYHAIYNYAVHLNQLRNKLIQIANNANNFAAAFQAAGGRNNPKNLFFMLAGMKNNQLPANITLAQLRNLILKNLQAQKNNTGKFLKQLGSYDSFLKRQKSGKTNGADKVAEYSTYEMLKAFSEVLQQSFVERNTPILAPLINGNKIGKIRELALIGAIEAHKYGLLPPREANKYLDIYNKLARNLTGRYLEGMTYDVAAEIANARMFFVPSMLHSENAWGKLKAGKKLKPGKAAAHRAGSVPKNSAAYYSSRSDALDGELRRISSGTPRSTTKVVQPRKSASKISLENPQTLFGKTHDTIGKHLEKSGFSAANYKGTSTAYIYRKSEKAGNWEVTVNYGGGRHCKRVYASPCYYKVTGPNYPRTKIVDPRKYPASEWRTQTKWRIIDGRTGRVLKEKGERI